MSVLLTLGRWHPAYKEYLEKVVPGKNEIIWKVKNLIALFLDFQKSYLPMEISVELNHWDKSMHSS